MVINPIVGVYIPIIRIPIEGGMTIPNIATFDHGTHSFSFRMGLEPKNPIRSGGVRGFFRVTGNVRRQILSGLTRVVTTLWARLEMID